MSFIKYISNEQHYNEVLSLASKCKESLCIGTADIKDLHVKVGDTQEPFLMIVAELLKRGVDVMLIHAKEPGPNFREDFDRCPILFTKLRRVLCPRVHFKILIFDRDAHADRGGIADPGQPGRGDDTGVVEPCLA